MRYDDSLSDASSAFAVVSPCSSCKNQLSEMSAEGKPFCPRRKWQADLAAMKSRNEKVDPVLIPLTAYGTEGTNNEGDKSLRNPAYLDDGKITLVWIATLRDNSGLRDKADNQVTPSILDPAFNTEYIHCRKYPYIPAQHEAEYRQNGALKEGDRVAAITIQNQQFTTDSTVIDGDPSSFRPVPVEGIVNKVSLVYEVPRAPLEVDHIIQGA